jgi:hypothetical protein
MGSPQAREWEQAMKEEISSLMENDTYELSTLPEVKASVGGGGGMGVHNQTRSEWHRDL